MIEVVRVSVFCIIMKDFVDNWIPTVFKKEGGGVGKQVFLPAHIFGKNANYVFNPLIP